MAMAGTVKFFNAERGYGFIKPDDGGRDVFVHITAVERAGLKALTEGQRISFDVEPDKKGKTFARASRFGLPILQLLSPRRRCAGGRRSRYPPC
jgi:cold shock protein